MAKSLELPLSGLWTAPNDYTCPKGALDVADNIVIDQKDLGQSRRGFETEIDNSDGSLVGFPCRTILETRPTDSSSDLLTYRYNTIANSGKLLLNDENTITGDNDFSPPSGTNRVSMVPWGEYIYVNSDEGIKRYSIPANSSVPAGIPQALDLVLELDGTSGYLTSNDVADITATVTNASALLTRISNEDVQEFSIGQYITGTGIPDGTTVSDVSLSTPVVIYSADLTAGTDTIVVTTNTGIAVGQLVSGDGIPDDSRVLAIGGGGPYNIQLSNNVIQTDTGVTVTFSSDNQVTMSAAATSGAPTVRTLTLSTGSQVAYRLVWGLRNENDAIMLGAPSGFTAIVNNTGGTRNVSVNASIPEGITTDYFYQLFRSNATPTADIAPADQMQLVAEGVPAALDISNGYIEILDQTPDSLKGEPLYTGTDQEGIQQSNYRPPTARDIGTFNGYVLYANYTLPAQLKLTIDGVGAPNGVQVGDEITVSTDTDSFILTAAATEDTAAGEFEIFTTGTPAQNIADTTASFIRVLNRYADNDICYAFSLSGPNDLPGQMLLEARATIGVFDVEANTNGTAWTPDIDDAVSATEESLANGILVSKVQEPEASPRVNLFRAGGLGNEILRIVPLRDYVVVLTTQGIFRMTGRTLSDFDVAPFDITVVLVGPATATSLGNECWCLSTQGVVSISDGGVRIRSGTQINDVIQSLIQGAPDSLRDYAFSVGYESNQRFILALPDSEGDTTCTQEYCYNYITDRWTRWTRNCTTGYVSQVNGLYLANGNNDNIVRERTNGNFTDFVDESIYVEITAFDGLEVTLDSVAGLTVGDVLWQNQAGVTLYSQIVEIDVAASTVTVASERDWDTGGDPEDTRVLMAINNVIQWKPHSAGDPTEAKQYSEGQILFRKSRFLAVLMRFATDISTSFSPVEMQGATGSGWGFFAWGLGPWGGSLLPKSLRFFVPADKQYCGVIIPRLEIRSGYSDWLLEGISLTVNDISGELGGSGADE